MHFLSSVLFHSFFPCAFSLSIGIYLDGIFLVGRDQTIEPNEKEFGLAFSIHIYER